MLSKHVQCECITQCMEIYRGISTALGASFIYCDSEVRGHGHAAGNFSTFFNSKSGNCLARRLSAISVDKNHPKVFRYADSN